MKTLSAVFALVCALSSFSALAAEHCFELPASYPKGHLSQEPGLTLPVCLSDGVIVGTYGNYSVEISYQGKKATFLVEWEDGLNEFVFHPQVYSDGAESGGRYWQLTVNLTYPGAKAEVTPYAVNFYRSQSGEYGHPGNDFQESIDLVKVPAATVGCSKP